MLIVAGKRLREAGKEEKAKSQFVIAQRVIDAFRDDFVEEKWFTRTVYEYMDEQREEIKSLLAL